MVYSAYMAMADADAYERPESPFMGLSNPAAASLRCFQRYSREPHRDVTDGDGISRWVSVKQARVYAIIHRIAMSTDPTAKMSDIAAEAGCTVSTVSRTINKLQGWAMYAIEVRRGRKGGVTVHRRGWDRFSDYVTQARIKIRELAGKARLHVQRRNVASREETYRKDAVELKKTLRTLDASFTDYMAWREARSVQAAPPE